VLLKSKIIDFEILSHVHVYRIEYVSCRQGLYRIRIVSAADRIVAALLVVAPTFRPTQPKHLWSV